MNIWCSITTLITAAYEYTGCAHCRGTLGDQQHQDGNNRKRSNPIMFICEMKVTHM